MIPCSTATITNRTNIFKFPTIKLIDYAFGFWKLHTSITGYPTEQSLSSQANGHPANQKKLPVFYGDR
jgi:hypothetical protein